MPRTNPGFFSRLPRLGLSQILLAALVLLQFPLWFGQGGWIRVWRLEREIDLRQATNEAMRLKVAELEGEVRDFKKNPRAAEERARYELGMVQPGERFVQWGGPLSESSVAPPKKAGGRD